MADRRGRRVRAGRQSARRLRVHTEQALQVRMVLEGALLLLVGGGRRGNSGRELVLLHDQLLQIWLTGRMWAAKEGAGGWVHVEGVVGWRRCLSLCLRLALRLRLGLGRLPVGCLTRMRARLKAAGLVRAG